MGLGWLQHFVRNAMAVKPTGSHYKLAVEYASSLA